MAEIPGINSKRFYEKKWAIELIGIVPPIIAAGVTAWQNYSDPTKRNLSWWLIGGIGWLAFSSLFKVLNAYAQDREEKQKQDYEGLLGSLHVIYSTITEVLNFDDKDKTEGRLRMTIHRVVPPVAPQVSAEELEQILPYLGGTGKKAGRKFSIRSGIIGRAARDKTPFAFSRQNDDHEAFIKEMVNQWAYTQEDARSLTSNRKAWMAVPILDRDGNAVAVVYLDSPEKDFFTDAIKDLIIASCGGISSYVLERYK